MLERRTALVALAVGVLGCSSEEEDLVDQLAVPGGRREAALQELLLAKDRAVEPLLEALAEFGADPATTPMIGDALRDMQAGRALGCPRFLVRTGQGEATLSNGLTAEVEPVSIHDDLASVVDTLLDRNGGR